MGKATLSFDQITICNKRSDSAHNDNDWMNIVWFVQGKQVRVDTLQLAKPDGGTSLDTGAVIAPLASSVDCNDQDLVTATFLVVNLGSMDGAGQRAQAEATATAMAKAITDLYVRVSEQVVKEGVPLGDVFSDGIDQVRLAIDDSVGALFEDVIIPGIEDVLDILDVGPPNCNGEVVHGMAVFTPTAAYPVTSLIYKYQAASSDRCGTPPHTTVVYTEEREFAAYQFPTAPAPAIQLVPVHDQSSDLWLGTWAEDPNTPTPIDKVVVSKSLRASSLYSVEITERVDPIRDVVYQTGKDPISVHPAHVVPFVADVFGALRPWLAYPVAPTGIRAVQRLIAKPHVKALAAGAAAAGAAETATPSPSYQTVMALTWSRPVVGTLLGFRGHGPFDAPAQPGFASDLADAFHLVDQAIYLCLYEIRQGGKSIGNCVRYMRPDTSSFTHADVMLFRWNPVA